MGKPSTAIANTRGDSVVFDRTVTEAIRRTKIEARNDPAFIGGGVFRALGTGAVNRTILSKLQDTINARDYGVAGDGVTDDTAAVQVALDAGRDQSKVVQFTNLIPLISGPLTCEGPGLCFDAVSHGDSGGPGFLVTGSGYVAMTVTGNPQIFYASFYGTGNTVDGVMFGGPLLADPNVARAVVQHVRVFALDGFGVQVNKCYDSVFEVISVEQCGNALSYAVSFNDAGDTCNQTHVLRMQVEKANGKAIYISPACLTCTFDNIHSEQATPTTIHAGAFVIGTEYRILSVGSTDFTTIGASSNTVGVYFTATGAGSGTGTAAATTWYLGGSRCSYQTAMFASVAPEANASLHLNAGNTSFDSQLVVGAIDVVLEANNTVAIKVPEYQGTAHVLTGQLGTIQVYGGFIQDLWTDPNTLRFFGTHIASTKIGFAGLTPDPTLTQFFGCHIEDLDSMSTLSAATFHGCVIDEGHNLLRGRTVLADNTLVTCASSLAHSSGVLEIHDSTVRADISYTNHATIRGYAAIFAGNISRGDGGNSDVVVDDGSVCTGTASNVGIPTAGTHAKGERHKNMAPASASDLGWLCDAAGSPGTWVAIAFTGSGTTANALTIGTHLTGTSFNGSVPVTIGTDATPSNTPNTIMSRDGFGQTNIGILNVTNKIAMGAGNDIFLGNTLVSTPLTIIGYVTLKDFGGSVVKIAVVN